MSAVNAIILGLVQGLTEFLPVSSSGHLVIFQKFLEFESPGIVFEVMVHLATSLAIIVCFRRRIFEAKREYLYPIVIGSIPAAAVGLLFRGAIEGLFESMAVVGLALIVTGVMNFMADKAHTRRERVSAVDSLFIGLAQAFAIIPGISRSGSTIFAGTSMGIDRKAAAEFSFLLSVPVVLGANFLELSQAEISLGSVDVYLFGFAAAFVSGIIAIKVVIRILVERVFKYFGLYAIVAGLLTILFLV